MPVLVAGLVLAFLVMLLFGGTELDRGLLFLFSSGEAPRLKLAAGLLGTASQPIVLLALAVAGAAAAALRSRWQAALLLLAIIVIGRLLVDSLQVVSQGVRPALDERMLPAQQAAGYPSGQSANATITGFALAFLLTRHSPARSMALGAAATLALLAGMAQLILGANWPSDVIGGWALGLAWTLLLLRLAREDLGDGTPRPVCHSSGKERHMENRRTETARQTDDSELIENLEDTPSFGSAAGGQLQRDIGSRSELNHENIGEPGTERVRDSDKGEGVNLPRYNEK